MWIIIIHSLIIIGIIILWYRPYRSSQLRYWLILGVIVKIIGGWLVGILYHHYYAGGDTWNYFSDGVTLAQFARAHFSDYLSSWFNTSKLPETLIYLRQPRALLMSRIISIGCLLTNDNYWLVSTYLSLLSFAGVWFLVRTLHIFFPTTQLAANIAWLAFPSFVFWSSGILKETLAVGFISILIAMTLRVYFDKVSRQSVLFILPGLITIVMLWLLKYYYAAVLAPLLIAIILAKYLPFKRPNVLIRVVLLFIFLIALATFMHPNLNAKRVLVVIVQNHDVFVQKWRPDAIIHFWQLKPTFTSFLLNTPLALFSAWYRPLPFEINKMLAQIAGIENGLFLLISILAVRKVESIKNLKIDQRLWLMAAILFSVLLGTLLTLSTPNFGTLARYKVAFSPLLLYITLSTLLPSRK
ncbi:MAG: hypothetical protein AAF944_04790 [Bacteroidota bacterium]